MKLRDSDNLMSMLKRTEHQIIDIVDRGQRELHERKTNRMSSGGGHTPTNYGSQNNTVVNKTGFGNGGHSSNNTTGIDYNTFQPVNPH
jgi:hypothetical protein